MKSYTWYSESLADSSSSIYKYEDKVIVSISIKDYHSPIVFVHLSPDEARKMAQELIVYAYKIDSEALKG